MNGVSRNCLRLDGLRHSLRNFVAVDMQLRDTGHNPRVR